MQTESLNLPLLSPLLSSEWRPQRSFEISLNNCDVFGWLLVILPILLLLLLNVVVVLYLLHWAADDIVRSCSLQFLKILNFFPILFIQPTLLLSLLPWRETSDRESFKIMVSIYSFWRNYRNLWKIQTWFYWILCLCHVRLWGWLSHFACHFSATCSKKHSCWNLTVRLVHQIHDT